MHVPLGPGGTLAHHLNQGHGTVIVFGFSAWSPVAVSCHFLCYCLLGEKQVAKLEINDPKFVYHTKPAVLP